MYVQEVINEEFCKSDKFIARTCRIMLGFLYIVELLNLFGIFVVDKSAMNFVVIVSTILLLAPTFVFIPRKHKQLQRYIVSCLILAVIGIMYSVLTFHVILLFLLPVVIFNVAGTIVIMIISHAASRYFSVIPEEPFTTMPKIILFGLIPRLLIYLAFIYAFWFETKHNSQMLEKICTYANDINKTQYETVRSLAEISESKSGQTGQHVKRVSEYVRAMASELGIKGSELENLVTASMMHDIGKLIIPSEIIEKKGKLTYNEFEIVKMHTKYGYELLKNSPGRTMEIAKEIALEHHEHWDGTGYEGIKGENINYYSRIVAIADVYDALVSKRSYKEKWPSADAYNEIVSQSGKQFDPALVIVFEKCYPKFNEICEKYQD